MGAQIDPNATEEVSKPEKSPEVNPFEEAIVEAPEAEEKEEASDLLIEEDGDFFWVIQKVIWGIAKTLIILGIMMILIWVVWDQSSLGEESDSAPPVTEETISPPAPETVSEKEKVLIEPIIDAPLSQTYVSRGPRADIFISATLGYDLWQTQVRFRRDILERSIVWLDRARILGEFSPQDLRQIPSNQRAGRVEELIGEAEALFTLSVEIRAQLKREMDQYLSESQAQAQLAQELESQIKTDIQNFREDRVSAYLVQQKTAQSLAAGAREEAKIRELLGQNVTNFDRLLRQKAIPLLGPPTTLRAIPE